MPFHEITGFAFTQASIQDNAPAESGVYGLYKAKRWIYVGESDNIQQRLLEHVAETKTCIKRKAPASFVYLLVEAASRVVRQKALIRELHPACNRR